MNHHALCQLLLSLDGRSYKAYKKNQGSYQFPEFDLYIDYVQGDPFAAPSRVRVIFPQSVARFLAQIYQTRSRAIAYLRHHYLNGITPLSALLNYIESDIDTAGIDILTPYPQGDLVRFRTLELAAVFNRLRSLTMNNLTSSR